MMSWRPIATAPKDGTNVLLFNPDMIESSDRPTGMESQIVVGCYRGRKYDNNGTWVCDVTEPDCGYYPGDFDIEPVWLAPTHWMPLPDQPRP